MHQLFVAILKRARSKKWKAWLKLHEREFEAQPASFSVIGGEFHGGCVLHTCAGLITRQPSSFRGKIIVGPGSQSN
jgi:hypothetical protein